MNNCKWAITSYCGTNPAFRQCIPQWICSCTGDINCYQCERFCFAACPAWSEWVSMESPYLWSGSPVFRLRKCPCEHAMMEPLDSQVYQSDRTIGHCVQTRLPSGIGAPSWDSFFFCLFLMFLLLLYLLKECWIEMKCRRDVSDKTGEPEDTSKKSRRNMNV